MSEEKAIVLKDSTIENTARIEAAGLKVLKDGTVEKPEELFEKFLEGSGHTLADIKKGQAIVGDFATALGNALGQQGLAVMAKDKSIEIIATEVKVGNDKIGAQLNQKQDVPDGKGGQTTIYGNLSMKYTAMGASNSRGEMKKVRTSLRNQAAKILAD